MSEIVSGDTFDPYHKWLGISPKDQPPHYYRLLAIDLFEADADVISAAADKQMAYVRSLQAGKNALLSQKILNEIAKARVCLLNAAKKEEYDSALRKRFAATAAASGIQKATRLPVAAVVPVSDAPIVLVEVSDSGVHQPPPMESVPRRKVRPAQKTSLVAWAMRLLFLGAMAAIWIFVVIYVVRRSQQPAPLQTAAADEDSVSDHYGPTGATPANSAGKPRSSADSTRPAVGQPRSTVAQAGGSPRVTGNSPSGESPSPAMSDSHTDPTAKPGPQSTAVKPPSADASLIDDSPVPAAQPAAPAVAEKPLTVEELDKQLAAAKTSEEYEEVAKAALSAAAQAIDAHQSDAVRPLVLKALVAARKSGNAKLIVKVTRAVAKPDTVKEILADSEQPEGDSGLVPRPRAMHSPQSSISGVSDTPAANGGVTLAVPRSRRASILGNPASGFVLGAVREGTTVTVQYESGEWTDRTTGRVYNPEDRSQLIYRVAIATRDAPFQIVVLPHDMANRPFQWRADRDYNSLVLRCHILGANATLSGRVYYRVTVTPPAQ